MIFPLRLSFILAALVFMGCARAPIKSPEQAMRISGHLKYHDDLELLGLFKSLKVTIEQLRLNPDVVMNFGPYQITRGEYARDLELLVPSIDLDDTGEAFQKALQDQFVPMEVFGTDQGWSKVFITSYYTPEMRGHYKRTTKYSSPILSRPTDMVKIPIADFVEALPALEGKGLEDLIRDGQLRGRLEKVDGGFYLKPYWSREEIGKLKGKERPKVIAWADPVDLFFLQIQGSGRLRLPKGEFINLNYAEQNGHPYYPIGRALTHAISPEEMSLQSIETYLRAAPSDEREKIIDLNKSYVFFEKSPHLAMTAFGVEAQDGRTIATDRKHFPKGALGYLIYPGVSKKDSMGSRFVLDHDTGGAIRGPGRVDLYWGIGDDAEEVSGRMKGEGRLYYFIPKRLVKGVTSI